MPKAISTELVIDISAIPNYRTKLFGSLRILYGMASFTTDYDMYFHISELESLGTSLFELKSMGLLHETSSYITSKPKYGNVLLLLRVRTRQESITADILLFTDERDVAIMDKVLDTLEHSNARQLLRDKPLRISVYNYMLQLEGFTQQNKENACMDIATKQIHDLIVKSYYETPSKHAQVPGLVSPANWCSGEKVETSNTDNKEQSWLKNTYTKLKNTFTRKLQKNSTQFTV